jgi:hypothetical protein
MIRLLREYIDRFPTLAKETFRRLVANSYIDEADESVRIEIINLGCAVMQ